MTTENGPSARPRTDISLVPFGERGGALTTYEGTDDLDQKALVLNEQIVDVREDVATPQSTRLVALIAKNQHDTAVQFRSDAVVGLSNENLVALFNSISMGEDEVIDPISGAIRRIQQADQRTGLKEVGFDKEADQILQDRDVNFSALEEEIIDELTERLNETSFNAGEHRILIAAIDNMITPQAVRKMSKSGKLMAAFFRSARGFRNDELRSILQHLQESLED